MEFRNLDQLKDTIRSMVIVKMQPFGTYDKVCKCRYW